MKNYEQKCKKALGWMQSLYTGLHGKTREEAETYFPELKESEDEKIRKEIIFFFEQEIPQCSIEEHKEYMRKWISWLEKQGEQSSWSEEDEKKIMWLVRLISTAGFRELDNDKMPCTRTELIDWLKSIKVRSILQSKQELSDEYPSMIDDIISLIQDAPGCLESDKEKMIDWLKSPKPHWKPTKEQMEALKCSYKSYIIDGKERRTLESLYNDLKKL